MLYQMCRKQTLVTFPFSNLQLLYTGINAVFVSKCTIHAKISYSHIRIVCSSSSFGLNTVAVFSIEVYQLSIMFLPFFLSTKCCLWHNKQWGMLTTIVKRVKFHKGNISELRAWLHSPHLPFYIGPTGHKERSVTQPFPLLKMVYEHAWRPYPTTH